MENENDTPPPPSKKKKGGRPKGRKNFSPVVHNNSTTYTQTITMAFREKFVPEVLGEYWSFILQGRVPILEVNEKTGAHRVIDDPNPNAQTPTLRDRVEALKEVQNRRDGMAPQSVHIDAMLKTTVQHELPPELLAGINAHALALIARGLELASGPTDTSDAVDAEFTMAEMQEPSQVVEPEKTSGEG